MHQVKLVLIVLGLIWKAVGRVIVFQINFQKPIDELIHGEFFPVQIPRNEPLVVVTDIALLSAVG